MLGYVISDITENVVKIPTCHRKFIVGFSPSKIEPVVRHDSTMKGKGKSKKAIDYILKGLPIMIQKC